MTPEQIERLTILAAKFEGHENLRKGLGGNWYCKAPRPFSDDTIVIVPRYFTDLSAQARVFSKLKEDISTRRIIKHEFEVAWFSWDKTKLAKCVWQACLTAEEQAPILLAVLEECERKGLL
jgi:hypothetical protein